MTRFSPLVTPDFIVSLRFALLDFFIFKWFIPVLPRLIFPVPVDSNRLAAVLQVLSFGGFVLIFGTRITSFYIPPGKPAVDHYKLKKSVLPCQ